VEQVGQDRWGRAYWVFDGIPDRVWVCTERSANGSNAGAQRIGAPEDQEGNNYGCDGARTSDFAAIREKAAPTAEWACYWRDDGTLQVPKLEMYLSLIDLCITQL